jgi:hypothetical protein
MPNKQTVHHERLKSNDDGAMPFGNFYCQKDAARAIGLRSGAWLCERKADPLYAPALRLGVDCVRYHEDQIRLWLAVASGNQTVEDATEEWAMIRRMIGRRPLTPKKKCA